MSEFRSMSGEVRSIAGMVCVVLGGLAIVHGAEEVWDGRITEEEHLTTQYAIERTWEQRQTFTFNDRQYLVYLEDVNGRETPSEAWSAEQLGVDREKVLKVYNSDKLVDDIRSENESHTRRGVIAGGIGAVMLIGGYVGLRDRIDAWRSRRQYAAQLRQQKQQEEIRWREDVVFAEIIGNEKLDTPLMKIKQRFFEIRAEHKRKMDAAKQQQSVEEVED